MATALRRFIPVVIRATPQRRQCVQPPSSNRDWLALEAAHGVERLREQHRSLIQAIWGRLKSFNSLFRLRDSSDLARSGINCSKAAP